MGRYDFKCPHCNSAIHNVSSNSYSIGTPIRTCPHCQKEYIFHNAIEWSVSSPIKKIFYAFICNWKFLPYCYTLLDLRAGNYKSALIVIGIWSILCLIFLLVSDFENIKDSRKRTRDNPQYIRKLINLGYKVDKRFEVYY